jgi:hypothetical protein
MQPTKSTKYRKHYASKKDYPTRAVAKAPTTVGSKAARRDLENRLGRKLNLPDNYKARTSGGNWVFEEPIHEPAEEARS